MEQPGVLVEVKYHERLIGCSGTPDQATFNCLGERSVVQKSFALKFHLAL